VNTAESIVGVQTPLSWSFWDDGGERGFRRAYCELGFLPSTALVIPDRVEEKFTAIFYGRAATNVTAFRAALDAMPFSATNDAEESFFSSRSDEARSGTPRQRRLAASVRLPWAAFRLPGRLVQLRAASERFWRDSLQALPREDAPAAMSRFDQAMERFSDEVAAQIVASTLATFFSSRLQRLIADQTAAHPEEAEDLQLRLLGGFGDLEEIRVSAELWQVAQGTLDRATFLARNGFRGPADGELSSRSWREDPTPIEQLAASYRTLPESRSPAAAEARRRRDREAAAGELLDRVRGFDRLRAEGLLRLARRYVPLRVIAKAAFQQTFDVARAAARRIGALHADAGRLDDAEDVFYLTREELLQPPGDARARVASRRALRSAYQLQDLPLEFSGMPEPIALDSPDTEPRGLSVSGLGVSAGVVEGVARVVLDPGTGELQPGEILVCSTTDPSWSAYFLLAAGVVIDVGGAMSHGAIVARELGIPCVINTIDGTRRLTSGMRVRVDGGVGQVEVLS
jgi:pyruvate,water dikinase